VIWESSCMYDHHLSWFLKRAFCCFCRVSLMKGEKHFFHPHHEQLNHRASPVRIREEVKHSGVKKTLAHNKPILLLSAPGIVCQFLSFDSRLMLQIPGILALRGVQGYVAGVEWLCSLWLCLSARHKYTRKRPQRHRQSGLDLPASPISTNSAP